METPERKRKSNAGRPPGSMSKIAAASREAALATGMLPHEILLSMARGLPQKRAAIDPKTGAILGEYYEVPDMEQSKDAAKAAAPYYAPKISTVEVIRNVDDAELDFLIAELAAQTGVTLGTDREAEESEEEAGASRSTGGAAPLKRIRKQLASD